jgi:hypothetical protein
VLEKLFNNGLAVLDGIRGADEKAEIEKGKVRRSCLELPLDLV